jgi:hypothetical protein
MTWSLFAVPHLQLIDVDRVGARRADREPQGDVGPLHSVLEVEPGAQERAGGGPGDGNGIRGPAVAVTLVHEHCFSHFFSFIRGYVSIENQALVLYSSTKTEKEEKKERKPERKEES